MANSRLQFLNDDPRPSNTNKGKGLILETPYHPGFVDDKDLETVKMAIDKELADISNAFYQTTEKTADTITRVDKLEIGSGEGFDKLYAAIEQVDKVSKEGDVALAERIVTLKAESEAGDVKLENEMSVVSDKTGKLEARWGIQMDVNGKISGVSMNNDGATSEFNVVADKFRITDGVNDLVPFEVVGGNTRIKSALINHIQSDNWDGTNGWAINNAGQAIFRSGEFKGDIRATSGTFDNVTINSNCAVNGNISGAYGTFTGGISIQDQGGAVGMKITNSQILIYDEYGRLRVKLGRL